MPKRFPVRLPTTTQRKSILALVSIHYFETLCRTIGQMLRDVALESNFDLDHLARRTEGLSGSDLRELCRNAAGAPVREHLKILSHNPSALDVKKEVSGIQPIETSFPNFGTDLLAIINAGRLPRARTDTSIRGLRRPTRSARLRHIDCDRTVLILTAYRTRSPASNCMPTSISSR